MGERIRRTYSQIFLDGLTELSQGEPVLISNRALREYLGWDDERYDRIKWQLYEANQLNIGRGQGGSVGLTSDAGADALSLFVSYCHADRALKDEFLKHLEPLKRQNLIDTWHDREIVPGEDWDQAISENLEVANIIVLLVSIDFINSEYCYDLELDRALELHEDESAVVVPVILRPCMWQHSPFAKLQVLPQDAKAVSTWSDRDEALTNVAEGIRSLARKLLAVEQ